MARRRTHKKGGRRQPSNSLSVEALHASFEKLDRKVIAAIRGGASDSALADVIDRAWSGLFQHSLSGAAARGLVHHYRTVHGSGSGSKRHTRRRGRKQKGGMAPVDWTLGQGTTEATTGRFPVPMYAPRVVSALDTGRFFESQVSRACDSTGGAPAPGQSGGAFFDPIKIGHAPDSVPQNYGAGMIRALQAETRPFGPSADPVRAVVPIQNPMPAPFDTTQVSSLSSLGQVYSGF